jgi:hypothetical protein
MRNLSVKDETMPARMGLERRNESFQRGFPRSSFRNECPKLRLELATLGNANAKNAAKMNPGSMPANPSYKGGSLSGEWA